MKEEPKPSPFRSLALVSVGMVLVISTLVGAGGGYALDRWLGTAPWLMIVGLLLGMVAGFREMLRMIERYGEK
jgi:ATP synthase protein I